MDIHGGGFDLRFPHHDNELAQSEVSEVGTPARPQEGPFRYVLPFALGLARNLTQSWSPISHTDSLAVLTERLKLKPVVLLVGKRPGVVPLSLSCPPRKGSTCPVDAAQCGNSAFSVWLPLEGQALGTLAKPSFPSSHAGVL